MVFENNQADAQSKR